MKKYYGLQLIRVFFLAVALIVCITSIGAIGYIVAQVVLANQVLDVILLLAILVFGGLLALVFYVLSQLIDLQMQNYEASWKLLQQIAKANELNTKTVELLNKQMRMMSGMKKYEGEDISVEVQHQIKQRRTRLE
jgi:ABC-type bacteriocin/lantibiotic exporter with double-glycine peptidase domain